MSFKTISRFFSGTMLIILLLQISVKGANVPGEGFGTLPPRQPPELDLVPFLTTKTSSYAISLIPTDAQKAQNICQIHGGNLLTVTSTDELESLKNSLDFQLDIPLWTSGICYSNATVENLLIWSSTLEPFTFKPVQSDLNNLRLAGSRNRRAVSVEVNKVEDDDEDAKDCNCPCPPKPTPAPPTSPPCKRPTCSGFRPPCTEDKPRQCIISRPPLCNAQEKNCTVDCGRPEDCQVLQQPVCKVIESSRPRCRLEVPNLGKCRTVQPQKCAIVAPGYCHSLRVDCRQEPSSPCDPIIKPCKNPCSQQECTSVQPPCTSHQPPCVTTTTPCPAPPTPGPDCMRRCKRSTSDKESRFKCEQSCNNPPPPTDCGQPVIVCPEPVTVCPEPVTSCTKPFVDCSPLICQSNVHICPPPKVQCPPPQVICEAPQIRCDDPQLDCPEPEVICDQPEVQCSKPIIKCPDPVVNCDPVITTCETTPFLCSDPVLTCPNPEITCEEPTICPSPPPVVPPPDNGGGGCQCSGGSKCRGGGGVNGKRKSKREILPEELNYVEKTECIAMTGTNTKTEWVAQNCNLKHRFICQM